MGIKVAKSAHWQPRLLKTQHEGTNGRGIVDDERISDDCDVQYRRRDRE